MRTFCMKTVVMALMVPASMEVPDRGKMTQDTAAMERRGLYPHNPAYTWGYSWGERKLRGRMQPMVAPRVHMQNSRGEYRMTARLIMQEDGRQ